MTLVKMSAQEFAQLVLEAVAHGDFPVYYLGQNGQFMVSTQPPAMVVLGETQGVVAPEPSRN